MPKDLSRFDPRLLETWRLGAESPVVLPFPARNLAVRMRQELYRVRRALEENNHPLYESAKRAQARLVELPHEGQFQVVVEPVTHAFESAFAKAGITVPSFDEDKFDI